jgi:hypothetical protein
MSYFLGDGNIVPRYTGYLSVQYMKFLSTLRVGQICVQGTGPTLSDTISIGTVAYSSKMLKIWAAHLGRGCEMGDTRAIYHSQGLDP